jgi:hypothetical protein
MSATQMPLDLQRNVIPDGMRVIGSWSESRDHDDLLLENKEETRMIGYSLFGGKGHEVFSIPIARGENFVPVDLDGDGRDELLSSRFFGRSSSKVHVLRWSGEWRVTESFDCPNAMLGEGGRLRIDGKDIAIIVASPAKAEGDFSDDRLIRIKETPSGIDVSTIGFEQLGLSWGGFFAIPIQGSKEDRLAMVSTNGETIGSYIALLVGADHPQVVAALQ